MARSESRGGRESAQEILEILEAYPSVRRSVSFQIEIRKIASNLKYPIESPEDLRRQSRSLTFRGMKLEKAVNLIDVIPRSDFPVKNKEDLILRAQELFYTFVEPPERGSQIPAELGPRPPRELKKIRSGTPSKAGFKTLRM